MALARTALGTVQSKTLTTMTIVFGAVVATDDLIVVVLAQDDPSNPPTVQYRWDGAATQNLVKNAEAINTANVVSSIWSVVATTTANASADILVTVVNSGTSRAAAALKVTGNASSPFDKAATGIGTGTSPSSGATATLAQADEICIGAVGTEGPVEDAAGTWSNSFNNGQRDGTTGGSPASNITVSEGFLIVSSTAAQTAAKTSITSRDWAAAIATYKAAAAATVDIISSASMIHRVDMRYRSKQVIPY